MRRRKHSLDRDDKKILSQYAEARDLNYLSAYYLNDFEFMPFQHEIASATVGDIVLVGGVGCGKTRGHAAEELCYGLLYRNYASMTLAPTSWQAALSFRHMKSLMEGGPFEKFLAKEPIERPWPQIELTTGALYEFRSAADINYVQGWEGDSMTIDEAGVIANGDEVFSGMASRLRGEVRAAGGYVRHRRGRLAIITASYLGADWVWAQYDAPKTYNDVVYEGHNREVIKGQPIHHLRGSDQISMTVTSEANVGLSELDLTRMRRRISKHLQGIQMEGDRPTGLGLLFTMTMVELAEDWSLNTEMEKEQREDTRGYDEAVVPGIGPVKWAKPPVPDAIYLLAGDPGTTNPPLRNSPVIMVFDVSLFPREAARLVYFHWIHGSGSINPFLIEYFKTYNLFRPAWALFDATGTQKWVDETVWQGWNLQVEGFDFSGMKKNASIGDLQLLMSRALIRFPYISGLRSQLTGYTLPDTNIAQDLVSTLCQVAQKLKSFLGTEAAEVAGATDTAGDGEVEHPRNIRSGNRTMRRR